MVDWPVPTVMVQVPVLQLPNFNETFIIKTDASGVGVGVVLQKKEFLAVIQALEKWRGNLLDRHFIIKTNHFSLKYLLEQRITTPKKMKWFPKLMGFDYEIMYKRGAKNMEADALLIVHGQYEFLKMVVTTLSNELNGYSRAGPKRKPKPSTEWKGQSQSTKEIEGWDLLENHLTQQAHLVFALTKEAQAASPRDEDFGYK
ncbi:putative mitochondrial protein [Tanacetum coccineum]|uniref:Mitochondrial protein n=1 Tax=Tanacetum coccineum TaxID=301880 RepID=A0ABQ5C3I2_9ASTR